MDKGGRGPVGIPQRNLLRSRQVLLLWLILLSFTCLCFHPTELAVATAATVEIPLQSGWNLVSIPVDPPDTSLPAPLASLQGNYTAVFAYNASCTGSEWTSYVPDRPPFLNTLQSIDENRGFWINMTVNATLTVNGSVVELTSFALKKGWNLIGYPALSTESIATALGNVSDTVSIVYAYNASDVGNEWRFYSPDNPASSLHVMTPGAGYWVNATRDVVWTFNGTRYDTARPDLTVASVLSTPLVPTHADTVALSIGTNNAGAATDKNVTLKVWDDYDGNRTLLATLYWKYGMAASAVEESFLQLGYLSGGNHTIVAEVDPDDTLREENETNNVKEYHVRVLAPLTAAITAAPTSGEAPLKVNFTGTASGGIAPYAFVWDGCVAPYLKRGDNVSYIYSIPGSYMPSLAVTDQRGYSAVAVANITVQANSLAQPADFAMDITDVSIASNRSVRINATASNLASVYVAAVRATVRVWSSDDPAAFDECFYDEILVIPGNSSRDITVIADNLKPGNYTARADINFYGAVPETDWANYTNNADLQDFTFTGTGYLPPVSIENLSVNPAEPVVNNLANAMVAVRNNGLYYRLLQARFYCINATDAKEFVGTSRIEKLEVGDSVTFSRLFQTPIRANTTVYVDIVDVLMNDTVVASDSREITLTPYDFSITNLSISPETNASDAVPLEITAQINNLRNVSGDVKYSLLVDGLSTVIGPFIAHNVPGNGSTNVTLSLGWSGTDSVVFRRTEYQLPKPVVGNHTVVVLLESIQAGTPWSALFDSDLNNNALGDSITVLKGPDCRIQRVEVEPHPQLERTSTITVDLSNAGQVADTFNLAVDNEYFRWNDSQYVIVPIGQASVYLAPNASTTLNFSWLPTQSNWQWIEVSCGGNRYSKELSVYPAFRVIGTYYYVDQTTWSDYVADAHYDYAYVDEENRLRLWALANAWTGKSTSHLKGAVYQEVVVDDGTTGNDSYGGYAEAEVGFTGIIDTLSYGSFTDTEFGTVIIVGITESGNESWKNGRILYASASDDEIFIERMGLLVDAASFVGGLAKTVGNYLSGAFLIVETAQLAEDFEACAGFGYYNYSTRIPYGLQQPFEFQNKKRYKVFIYQESLVESWSGALGSCHVYTDYYNRAPYECCDSTDLPKRGIWLGEPEFTIKYRRFG